MRKITKALKLAAAAFKHAYTQGAHKSAPKDVYQAYISTSMLERIRRKHNNPKRGESKFPK